MFIEQPPWFFRALYPQAIFRMDPNERAVYLTFDDGPIPEVTPWVLELLKKHDIKATFFMVGDNIRKHPDEYRMAIFTGPLDFDTRFLNRSGETTLNFNCKPHRYIKAGTWAQALDNGQVLLNNWDESLPLIQITGGGGHVAVILFQRLYNQLPLE